MIDYNKRQRIKKIKESNEYLTNLVEMNEIPELLRERIDGNTNS